LYVIKAASLVVWSQIGLRRTSQHTDPNRGHLIYEQHVVAQAVDYGYVLHKKALEIAMTASSTEQITKAQQALINMKRSLQDASCFGELQEALQRGWHQMGVDDLLDLISESLDIRGQSAVENERLRVGRWRFVVSAFLGVLAALGISDQVVLRIWQWREWPLPTNRPLADLLLCSVALAFVVVALGLAWTVLVIWRRRR